VNGDTERLVEALRRQGFDSGKGDVLVMPADRRGDFDPPPSFMQFSPLVTQPLVMRGVDIH
jgi:hypothetical protein